MFVPVSRCPTVSHTCPWKLSVANTGFICPAVLRSRPVPEPIGTGSGRMPAFGTPSFYSPAIPDDGRKVFGKIVLFVGSTSCSFPGRFDWIISRIDRLLTRDNRFTRNTVWHENRNGFLFLLKL